MRAEREQKRRRHAPARPTRNTAEFISASIDRNWSWNCYVHGLYLCRQFSSIYSSLSFYLTSIRNAFTISETVQIQIRDSIHQLSTSVHRPQLRKDVLTDYTTMTRRISTGFFLSFTSFCGDVDLCRWLTQSAPTISTGRMGS